MGFVRKIGRKLDDAIFQPILNTVEAIIEDPKKLAMVALSIMAPGAGTALGSALGLSGTAATIVGQAAINTALNGGDVKAGILAAAIPVVGKEFAGTVSNAFVESGMDKALADSAGKVVSGAGVAAAQGKDPLTALISGGLSEGTAAITRDLPGFSDLPDAAKRSVNAAIATELLGGDGTQSAINAAINTGINALSNYTNSLDEKTTPDSKDFIEGYFQPGGEGYIDLTGATAPPAQEEPPAPPSIFGSISPDSFKPGGDFYRNSMMEIVNPATVKQEEPVAQEEMPIAEEPTNLTLEELVNPVTVEQNPNVTDFIDQLAPYKDLSFDELLAISQPDTKMVGPPLPSGFVDGSSDNDAVLITGGAGNDTMSDDEVNDFLDELLADSAGGSTVDSGPTNDEILQSINADSLVGGAANDTDSKDTTGLDEGPIIPTEDTTGLDEGPIIPTEDTTGLDEGPIIPTDEEDVPEIEIVGDRDKTQEHVFDPTFGGELPLDDLPYLPTDDDFVPTDEIEEPETPVTTPGGSKPAAPGVKPGTVTKPTASTPAARASARQSAAQEIAPALLGLPQLGNVFYYGKDFSSQKQQLDPSGRLIQQEYDPLSVVQAGAELQLDKMDGTDENDVQALIQQIMASNGGDISPEELAQILGQQGNMYG